MQATYTDAGANNVAVLWRSQRIVGGTIDHTHLRRKPAVL